MANGHLSSILEDQDRESLRTTLNRKNFTDDDDLTYGLREDQIQKINGVRRYWN